MSLCSLGASLPDWKYATLRTSGLSGCCWLLYKSFWCKVKLAAKSRINSFLSEQGGRKAIMGWRKNQMAISPEIFPFISLWDWDRLGRKEMFFLSIMIVVSEVCHTFRKVHKAFAWPEHLLSSVKYNDMSDCYGWCILAI